MDGRVVDRLEANKQVVRTHFQALNDTNYKLLDRIHDPQGRNHAMATFDLSAWPEEGVPFGPRESKERSNGCGAASRISE
jgi:hypothetical protein